MAERNLELEAAEVRETLTEARIALTEVMRIGNRARAASEIAAKVGGQDAQRVLSILTDSPEVPTERKSHGRPGPVCRRGEGGSGRSSTGWLGRALHDSPAATRLILGSHSHDSLLVYFVGNLLALMQVAWTTLLGVALIGRSDTPAALAG